MDLEGEATERVRQAEADVRESDGEAEEGAMNGRMCIVSRKSLGADALIRFVADPDGTVVPDLRRRLPGRGAHVEARRAAVDLAVKRKLFGRALKREVRVPESLGADVEAALGRAALGFFGLARKAGQLVTGATKVEAAVRSHAAVALLHAAEAQPDGLRKLDGARRAAGGASGPIPVFRPFSADEMGLAFGGGNVIHAAVLAGDAGAALLKRLEALSSYRGEALRAETEPARSSTDVAGMDVWHGIDPVQEAEA